MISVYKQVNDYHIRDNVLIERGSVEFFVKRGWSSVVFAAGYNQMWHYKFRARWVEDVVTSVVIGLR